MQQEHITEKARAEETVLTPQKPGSCWSAGPSLRRFTVMLETWGHTQQSEQEQDEDIVARCRKKCVSVVVASLFALGLSQLAVY